MTVLLAVSADRLLAHAEEDKDGFAMGGTAEAGNTIYRVFMQDLVGSGLGLYTVATGPSHPAGSGLNVLYGNGNPGTSFETVRSYTSNTDYITAQTDPSRTSANTLVPLSSFGAVTAIGTTGIRTTYVLPGPPTTPDALTIVIELNVRGTTVADSTVEVTTAVTNNGTAPVAIGIRYLWDMQIGSDDGPTFQQIGPDGSVLVQEVEFGPPTFVSYRIQDNDTNPSPPTFLISGTATGPGTLIPTPTTPDLLQYACWGDSFQTGFEYVVNPLRDVATTASMCAGGRGGDTAVLYFFGHDQTSAITLAAGASHKTSALLFLTQPGVQCGDGMVNQPGEQCDGMDDSACPGSCLASCTCPTVAPTVTDTPTPTPTVTVTPRSTPTVTVTPPISTSRVHVCAYGIQGSVGVFCPVRKPATVCLSATAQTGLACQHPLFCFGRSMDPFFCGLSLVPISGPLDRCPFSSTRLRQFTCYPRALSFP